MAAVVFLAAARLLPLAELGAFAAAIAAPRFLQNTTRAALSDMAVILPDRPGVRGALWVLALSGGALGSGGAALLATLLPDPSVAPARALAILPLVTAIAAIPEGALRRDLCLPALALRSVAVQIVAGGIALAALGAGWGQWALVGYALVAAILSALIAMQLAPPRALALPDRGDLAAVAPHLARLTLREAMASAPLPLAQLAVAAALGLPAAGAFQVATRIVGLADTLCLAPLRYVALPRLRAGAPVPPEIARAAAIGLWSSCGMIATAPVIAALVVPEAADRVAPVLALLAPTLAASALSMPLRQALVARGRTGAALSLAALTLALAMLTLLPALAISAGAVALAASAASTGALALWAPAAMRRAGLAPAALLAPLARGLPAGALMIGALATLPAMPGPALTLVLSIAAGTALFAAIHLVSRSVA